ncbi:hypothetical protein QNH39_18820 [Neobacillus novalis]|uniref:HNH endonuclease n=1 Tax=Neobacillus novalis TaxID=220687 RepID=A0AA95S9V4_9BACI|nr:hypothetical protein [Neobacillus novalis]WHY84689.1 hypothetical protein QNH39_18820 [Neobacillus novalis]
MAKKENFINWLNTSTNLSSNTTGKYSGAINTISDELGRYGLLEGSLYNITDPVIIESKSRKYLSIPEFIEKDIRGNKMYSNALRYYNLFAKYLLDNEFQAELFKEEQEFEKYLTENPADISKANIEDKPKDKPNYRSVNNKKVWSRNPKTASEAVADADYLCEFDNQHKHFISKFNGKNYVEAHHLIPMQYQEQFENSLDIHANIVSICLVCHKKIHFGLFEDKKEILAKLFNSRRERLIKAGIKISLAELYSFYQD